MTPIIRIYTATFFLLFAATSALADESPDWPSSPGWPSWRGSQGNGVAEPGDYAAQLDESTLRWQAPLPGKGCSTPIILDRNIFVTAPVDGDDAVLSFDWTGSERWRTVFGHEDPGKHRNASGCNASPVTDGDAVFVYFKSGVLAAVELDGTLRWQTNLVERYGEEERFWDHGTSPVLTEKHVVMARMHSGESFVAAFDKKSGELAWKVARNYEVPTEADQCYTTPLVIDYNGKESLLVWGAQHLTLHDAANGEVVWMCGGFNPDSSKLWPAISQPVIVDDMIVLYFGRNDRGKPRLHGVRLDGAGDVTATNRVWSREDTGAFVPSPALYEGCVYLLRDRGEVECIDPTTGDTIWADALPKGRGNYYASPLIAGGKLYAAREDGVVFVVKLNDDRMELLSENDMEESVIGSPIALSGRVFIRGEKHLFCF